MFVGSQIFYRALLLSSFLFLGTVDAVASDNTYREDLKARGEFSFRPGTDRNITLGEFWMPLNQDKSQGYVLYADYRVMGDSRENKEFNAGVGYRQMVDDVPVLGDGVVGVHGWFDRRLTRFDSKFNQLTVGAEWFSDDLDLKANAYYPLNKKNDFTRTNPNGAGAGFVGSQVIVNTDQAVREEALRGLDLEFGVRVPFLDDHTDSTRAYFAGFHFEGDDADSVTGWRTRFTSDINQDFQIGARFQHDDVRGSQGFLEATIRFPFGHKQSYKNQGLWARMDESPERDIDIVSNEVVREDGVGKTLINNTTSAAQNVIHVDNTNGGAEDGSVDNPYNTLVEAQAAAGTNDIIYVHYGDGTTTGMNAGITINDDGQMLIGSGANFTFDGAKFSTSNGANVNGTDTVLIAATNSPIITNAAGNGINVTADNVTISGITVDGATGDGVSINDGGDVIIENASFINNGSNGIDALFDDNGTYDFAVNTVNASDNTSYGVLIRAQNTTTLDAVVEGSTANGNGLAGIGGTVEGDSIGNHQYLNNTANNNSNVNLRFATSDNAVGATIMRNNSVDTTNLFMGVLLRVQHNSTITSAIIENNTVMNSDDAGIHIDLFSGVTSGITSSVIRNNNVFDNGLTGINIQANSGSGSITANLDNNTAINNGSSGIRVRTVDSTNATISLSGNTITQNTHHGMFFDDDSTGAITADLGGGGLNSTGNNSIHDNDLTDIRVDLDGADLKAEGNWWGIDTGLSVGEVLLEDGSTIDADPELTSAP